MFHFDSCGKQHMLKYVKKFKAMQHLSWLLDISISSMFHPACSMEQYYPEPTYIETNKVNIYYLELLCHVFKAVQSFIRWREGCGQCDISDDAIETVHVAY